MTITFLAPCKDLSGGIKVISIYGNKLIERGHHVTVIYPQKKLPLKQALKRRLIKLVKNEKDHLDRFKGRLIMVPEVTAENMPPADVLIATAWQTAEQALLLPESAGEKFYFIQGYETWSGQKKRVEETLKYPFTKITISSWLRKLVQDISGDPDVALIHNGKDFDLPESMTAENGRIYDIGMTYSAVPNKGGDIGLQVFNELSQSDPSLRFVIFGSEAPQGKAPAKTKVFVKPSQKKIAQIYRSTRIWISTSYEEGFCLPCLEAMSSGCVVISTDNKGVRDIITDGHNGSLVLPGRPGDLVKKFKQVLGNPQLIKKFQREGLFKSEFFSWEKSTDKLEKIILNKIKRKAA